MSRLSAYKILEMQFKENIFKFGVEWRGGGKTCILQRKTGHISETLRDAAKVNINH